MYHRRSIRLETYDYAQAGAYFVTICTFERRSLLGAVVADEMQLSPYGSDEMQLSPCGSIVTECWDEIPQHFTGVELDAFVVMPNHVHGIFVLSDGAMATRARHASPLQEKSGARPGSVGAIVGAFKSAASRRINQMYGTPGAPLWQRNYYERIIRNEKELNGIREYIIYNPALWEQDVNNPECSDFNEL
jgi:putative transposase